MSICPVCNGLQEIHLQCPTCGRALADSGRVMDFYDDYSPYMEIDLMKQEDGWPDTFSGQKCPHLFRCLNCGQDDIVFIKE